MELVVASNNTGKIREYRDILEPMGFQVFSQDEKQVHIEVEETGTTFEENAVLKAQAVYDRTGCCVISDDSGLSVDALNGDPGVHSARYAGMHGDDAANNKKLIRNMQGIPKPWTAKFVCAIALVLPGGKEWVVRGECPGVIIEEARGTGGFGYDPHFLYEELNQTFAEISQEDKNRVSHRAMAMAKMLPILRGL